jgi:glycerol uptake facilitator-like aquaporin
VTDHFRKLLAEALGSMLLFACVIGSGVMAERLSGGNVGIALLGNTVATAAMLFVLVSIFAPLSGAHFNPAVTLVAVLRRDLIVSHGLTYVAAQLIGGLAGVLLAHVMFDLPLWQLGVKVRSGPGQWLSEGVATFALVIAILGAVRHRPNWVPAIVASVITAGYWFTASTSFANPAITLGRALTESFAGIRPIDAPAFIVAQLAGACLAACCARILFPTAHLNDNSMAPTTSASPALDQTP